MWGCLRGGAWAQCMAPRGAGAQQQLLLARCAPLQWQLPCLMYGWREGIARALLHFALHPASCTTCPAALQVTGQPCRPQLPHPLPTRPTHLHPPLPLPFNLSLRDKHDSDSGTYDGEGRFIPQHFEEMFSKHDVGSKGGLTLVELWRMTQANWNAGDVVGWLAGGRAGGHGGGWVWIMPAGPVFLACVAWRGKFSGGSRGGGEASMQALPGVHLVHSKHTVPAHLLSPCSQGGVGAHLLHCGPGHPIRPHARQGRRAGCF